MDSAMDFTPPKKIRKLDSGDVGSDDLCDEHKPRVSDSLTNRILQVKGDENESKSKDFEEESKNIAADFSSPAKTIQKIQSGNDQLKSEVYESKRKIDTSEVAVSGEMSTNGLNIHKRHRKPDDENKTNETVTSPPKKAQKIDSLASTYDHKICKVEAGDNLNENSIEETIGKVVKATVGNFDISESFPAKVTSESGQTDPDQSSGDSNLSSPSKTQKSSCEKNPSSEKVDENKNVCLSSSVCEEEIEAKNTEEKSQLEKESDRHKSTKDLQEDVPQKTDYRETEQRTISVDETVHDDRIGTYKIDNGSKNTIESKESCEDFAQNKSESSMGRQKASAEKDINAVQNGRPIVTRTEGESACVGQNSINDPHAAEERDLTDSMKTGICVDKQLVISKDMEKTGDAEENEGNIPDLKVEVIKSSCDVSGFADSQNKVECQNSVTEFDETLSNEETKLKAESNDKLGDAINQSSLLNKDEDLSDLDQYQKRQQSVEVDNETVKNPGLSDLSCDKVKLDPDIRETEADDNVIRTNVTYDWSKSKNVSLDNSKCQNSVKLTGLCDAIDSKTNNTQPENESLLKDKQNEADEENYKVADNMAVEQNNECMEHNDTVKNNVECPKERSETNSAENGRSEHHGENSTGKMECQLPENGQKKNITDCSDTVNSKLDIADKDGGVVLENSDCQVSTKENENKPVSQNEETENSDGLPEESASEESKHLGKADQKTVDNSECKDSLKIKKAKLSDSETARTLDVDITPGFEQGQEFVKDKEIIEKTESKTELNNGQTKIKDINTTKDATEISNDNPTHRNCNESVASVLDRENRKPDLLNLDKVNNAQNMKSEKNVATDEPEKMVDGDMELDSARCQEGTKESGQNIADKIQYIRNDTTGQSNILKDDHSDLYEHEAKLHGPAEIKEAVTDVESSKSADISNETDPNQAANKTDKDDIMSRTDAVNDQPDKDINSALQDKECQHAIKQSNNMNNQTLPDDEENGTTLQKDAASNIEENSTKKFDMVTEQDKCLEPSVIAEDYDDSKDRGKNGGATDASNFATGSTPKERKEQYTDRDTTKGLEPNIPVNKTGNSYSEGQSLTGIATNPHGTGKDDKDLSVSQHMKRLETAEDYKENISDVKETKRDDSLETGADYTVDNDKPGGESDKSMEFDTAQEKEVFPDTNQQNVGNDGLKIDNVEAGEGNGFMECDAVQGKDYTGVNKENEIHNESEKHYKKSDNIECQDITKGDKDMCDSDGKNTFNNSEEIRSLETTEDMKNLIKDTKTVKFNDECIEPGAAEADSKDSAKENGNASSVSNEKGDTFDSEGKGLDPLINNGRYTDAEKASTNDESEDAKLSQVSSKKLESSNNETSKIANAHEETVIGSVRSVSASESCKANDANKNVKEITRDCQEEKDSHTNGCKTSDSLKDEEKSAVFKKSNHKTSHSLNDEATATSENEKINKNGSNCADMKAALSFEKNDKQLKYDDLDSGCHEVYLPEKINLKNNDEPKKMTNSEDLKTEVPLISNTVANDNKQNKSVEISKDKESNVSESLEKQKMSVSKEESLIEKIEDITHNARENRSDATEDISLEVETKDNTVNNEDKKKQDSLKDEENNGSVGCNDVIEPQANLVATKDEGKNSSGPENKNQEMDTQNISEDRQNP